MNLIWKTAEVEGEYWAFNDVEGPYNFRPVPVDDWSPVLRPLKEDFKILPWVLYEYLHRLLIIQVVWDVIIDELPWEGLKTNIRINIFSKIWNGTNGKEQGERDGTIV